MMTLKKSLRRLRTKVILAVGAHPDDIDIGCAGTVAKHIADGDEVYYLVLTDGSKGSEDLKIGRNELIRIRRSEQQKAAGLLGVKKVFSLDFADGELKNTPALRKQIVKIIRQIKPTTVICWDPALYYDKQLNMVNHPDHRIGGEATMDSIYPFARNARTFPELLNEGLKPHVVEELLIINFSNANYFVDIKSTVDKKIEAIQCHKSQFEDAEKFGERIKEMGKMLGQKSKMKYAEGFIKITLRKPS